MGAKTGLYLLPRHIQHQPIGQSENATEFRGGTGVNEGCVLIPCVHSPRESRKAGGGKGPLIQTNKTGSLQTQCGSDRCVFQPIGVDMYNQTLTGDKSKTMSSKATDSDHVPCVIVRKDDETDDKQSDSP